jgi:hypothetical protein
MDDATPEPDELRRMAVAIDADREPRVALHAELSAEAAQRLHDILSAVLADLSQHAGIETTWPLLRLLVALEETAP